MSAESQSLEATTPPARVKPATKASRRRVTFEAWRAELTARYLWSHISPLFSRWLQPRCARCILPQSCVSLDNDGLCPECAGDHSEDGSLPGGERLKEEHLALDEILRTHIGSGRGDFDALLLLSGGKDSAYLLHRVRRDYPGLRLLTVLVDNGFLSPHASRNVQRLVSRLGVEHLTLRLQPSEVHAVFRFALTHLHLQEGYSLVDHLDGQMTFDAARNLAAMRSIPLLLTGLAREQAQLVLGAERFELPREEELRRRTHVGGVALEEIGDGVRWWDGTRWPADRVARVISPMWTWDPGEREILAVLKRARLLDPRATSPLLTNNALIPVIGMAEVARFGHCCWEIELARRVRQGLADRAYWLAIFQLLELSTRTGRFIGGSVDSTLSELGLSREAIGVRS